MKKPAIILLAALFTASCTVKNKESANTLNWSTPEKIKGLDPARADDLYAATEVGRSYEGLLQYHYLKRPYTLISNLAETLPEISPDGRIYTFKIKKGVLFQDDPCFKETAGKGRELTADDFVYSIKRVADPKNLSGGWWLFDGKIAGLNEWRSDTVKSGAADYSKNVSGLRATDRYTLLIILTRKSPVMIYAFAMPYAHAVPKEAVDHYGKDFQTRAVGTGPFRLEEFDPAQKIIWTRNPTYRTEYYPSEGAPGDVESGLLADAGRSLPFLDKILVTVYTEHQPWWLGFLSGKTDLVQPPKDSFKKVILPDGDVNAELKQKNIRAIKTPMLDVTFDVFNMADPVIGKNKLLRQAISLAFNTREYIDLFFSGQAIAAQGPIPPGLPGYDPAFLNPYRHFNLAAARELLAKAGHPGGRGLGPLDYVIPATSSFRQMSEQMAGFLAAAGITMKVTAHTWPEFQNSIKNRRGQMWGVSAWSADYPDAENFMQMFYSKNTSPGPNDSGYSNPEFDRLYEKAGAEMDPEKRAKIYTKMNAIVAEDCPLLFKVHRITFDLIPPRLKNYKRHHMEPSRVKYLRVMPDVAKKSR